MNEHVYLIAEAGVNHNGSLARALDMVDVAAAAGADAVKFQTFVPSALATANAVKAQYQVNKDSQKESQLAMLENLMLDFDAHFQLLERCQTLGIDFLSSPFDLQSADFLLQELQLSRIKLGSGELTNAPLLWHTRTSDAELILSTGMATMDEIETALGVCCLTSAGETPQSETQCRDAFDPRLLSGKITLMHCTSEYPCPTDHANLRAIDSMRERFGLPIGYSDHTLGAAVSLAAVARGACMIEKHFTLDRGLPGPDHAASLLPEELQDLADGIRDVTQALGSSQKSPSNEELDNAQVARKSLVASQTIRRGESFTKDNLTTKRPGTGVTPLCYWSLLGTPAKRDYAADELIQEDE